MKVKRQFSKNARKKQLKVQHHKVNARRQFYFTQLLSQESTSQSKHH
ncbi:MAG: hypothetical protein QF552_13300 [Litorilituus sp.]|nr:hypothetical protein [Litorilituus sp.]